MRLEDELLYRCCRQDMSPTELERLLAGASSDLDWAEIFTLAYEHSVAPLVFRNLAMAMDAGLCVPSAIGSKFRLATYQNISTKSLQATTLTQVLASLQDEEIDVMAVKGMALDRLVYDEPWYTMAQDIDIVLRPRAPDVSDEDFARLEDKVAKRGVEYEFYEHHDVNLNRALPVDFGRIWRDASVVDMCRYALYLMSPEDMLLAVCINSCRKRYFRLRSLCDIAETVKRVTALDWATFVCKASEYGCANIVYTALSVTKATVGCPVPCHVLDELAVGAFKRRLIDGVVRFLLHNLPLSSLSYYAGPELVGRRIGWSLLLPYTTYEWREKKSKIHEALVAYRKHSH